ncbi:MAG: hypothetical protein ACTSQP_20240 [Promethearchaeota archaeon]
MTKDNVIIFSSGLSGSSVLTGFIARAGFWLGHNTKKIFYDTYENEKLVDLNIRLLKESGYTGEDVGDIIPPSIDHIKNLKNKLDLNQYKLFINDCNRHKPWIWKDPRLCYTIFFWKHLVDLNRVKFILMTRDLKQTWTGVLLRLNKAISYNNLKTINENCIKSAKDFLQEYSIPSLDLSFEDLIIMPEKSIEKINNFLSIDLGLADFREIYKGNLYKKRWSNYDYKKAFLKFYVYKYLLRREVKKI